MNKKENVKEFSNYLVRVIAEIVPTLPEEDLGIKRDFKKFTDYTSNLIVRHEYYSDKK